MRGIEGLSMLNADVTARRQGWFCRCGPYTLAWRQDQCFGRDRRPRPYLPRAGGSRRCYRRHRPQRRLWPAISLCQDRCVCRARPWRLPCSANDRGHEMVSARPCLAATVQKTYSGAARRASECSAARLAHLSGGQGVVGSNPATPTIFSLRIKAFSRTRRSASPDKNGTERHRNARCGTQSPEKVPKFRSRCCSLVRTGSSAMADEVAASMPIVLGEQRTLGCADLLGVVICGTDG